MTAFNSNMQTTPALVDPVWLQLRRQEYTANKILQWAGLVSPPVDVRDLARRMGIVVHEQSERSWSGAVESSERHATVWLNAKEGETRKRFTLAHEIGHLMLHPLGLTFRDTSFLGGSREAEANRFAADLLMPTWMLYPIAIANNGDTRALASMFHVSFDAMRIRLESMVISPR